MDINENDTTNSAKECFDIISKEYDHVIERANKLDNKVSIILAFTGIIFVVALELLNISKITEFPICKIQFNSIFIYLLLSVIDIALYITSISLYLIILLPKKLSRFHASALLENQLQKDRKDVVYNYTSIKYCNAITNNNLIIDRQYTKLYIGIVLETISIILSVILIFSKYILL